MQRAQKPGIRLPGGSHRFGAILESDRKPEPTDIRTFLLRAHEYGEEKLERALKSVMCRPQREISAETSGLVFNSERILFNAEETISSMDDLVRAANGLIIGRNALIPHYLSTEQYLKYLFRPYQELCCAAISESRPDLKGEYIRALGVLGNLLPREEKAKLGVFLVDLMKTEEGHWPRLAAIEALANLICAKAIIPMAEAAEAAGDRVLENAAFKASLMISIASAPREMHGILARFLFGDYSAEAKISAAFLMRSMKNPVLDATLSAYLRDVECTVAEIKMFAISRGLEQGGTAREMAESTNRCLRRFYDESRYINDVLAYSELELSPAQMKRC